METSYPVLRDEYKYKEYDNNLLNEELLNRKVVPIVGHDITCPAPENMPVKINGYINSQKKKVSMEITLLEVEKVLIEEKDNSKYYYNDAIDFHEQIKNNNEQTLKVKFKIKIISIEGGINKSIFINNNHFRVIGSDKIVLDNIFKSYEYFFYKISTLHKEVYDGSELKGFLLMVAENGVIPVINYNYKNKGMPEIWFKPLKLKISGKELPIRKTKKFHEPEPLTDYEKKQLENRRIEKEQIEKECIEQERLDDIEEEKLEREQRRKEISNSVMFITIFERIQGYRVSSTWGSTSYYYYVKQMKNSKIIKVLHDIEIEFEIDLTDLIEKIESDIDKNETGKLYLCHFMNYWKDYPLEELINYKNELLI
jgi:hypothetical protein